MNWNQNPMSVPIQAQSKPNPKQIQNYSKSNHYSFRIQQPSKPNLNIVQNQTQKQSNSKYSIFQSNLNPKPESQSNPNPIQI